MQSASFWELPLQCSSSSAQQHSNKFEILVMFITLNGNVYQIAITDASQLHPQAKVIDWVPEDAQGICFFFRMRWEKTAWNIERLL